MTQRRTISRAVLARLRRPGQKRGRRGPTFTRPEKTQPEQDFESAILLPLVASGDIVALRFQDLTLRAGPGMSYTPDFTAIDSISRRLIVYEVKGGYVYEDSVIKFKACAEKYTEFAFLWCERDDARSPWTIKPASTGIGILAITRMHAPAGLTQEDAAALHRRSRPTDRA